MKFYSEDKGYFWDIDKFQLFTESEKCSILAGLQNERGIWFMIKEGKKEKGGMIEMLENLIEELEQSLKK